MVIQAVALSAFAKVNCTMLQRIVVKIINDNGQGYVKFINLATAVARLLVG